LAVRYLTEAWASEALKLIETDARVKAALHGIDLSLLTIVLRPPADCYGFLYTAFDAGGLADYRVGHDYHTITKGIRPPTFVVSGEYGVFASIQRKELSERKAILSGKLHLTGPWMKALRHMKALEAITEALTAIPCET
jgi:hypothetical protein